MDPFELLKTDHRKVEQLFSQLESASGKQKLEVFKQIKTELELHTQIEEKIFYPALEEPEETHDLAQAYEEHAVVKDLLKQLGRARTANDEWEAQAKVLQENVEHHVEEEENELFAKAQAALGEEELEELGERMEAEKARKQRGSTSKKSGAAKKSASKTKSASTAAKRARPSKKGTSKSSGSKKSRSKKSAAKKR
jgi:hemerythrin-like domain-containing protein